MKKFFLKTLIVLVMLFIAAQTYRVLAHRKEFYWQVPDPYSCYQGRPGYSVKIKGGVKTINRFGFISTPDLRLRKPEGTIRIVFLGESSTAGVGTVLSDENTWPWQTMQLLKKEFPDQKFDFINGALAGYSSFASYGRLWSKIRFFEPDIIVVCHGWNEMYYFGKGDDIVFWSESPSFYNRKTGLSHWLKSTFLPAGIAQSGERLGLKTIVQLSKTYDVSGIEIWRTNLKLIETTARFMNAKLFVCKQPTLIVPGLAQDQRNRCRYRLHGFNHEAHVEAFRNIYRVIDEEIDSRSVIDLTAFSGKADNFYDHIHLTEKGALRIAEQAAGQIAAYLKVKEAQ